jgi:hypothetical protein
LIGNGDYFCCHSSDFTGAGTMIQARILRPGFRGEHLIF